MKFDYLERVVVDGQLDIDNIGQCVILTRNDLAEEWYLIIKTELGWTEVIEYGPSHPGFSVLPISVKQTYDRFEYNSSKIERIINKFLNDPKRLISQAEVTQFDVIREKMINPIDTLFDEEIEESDE
jgi:hypothetical protein